MPLHLLNFRYGFANNSSSSHSVILLKSRQSDSFNGGHYGWEAFTLASDEAKLKYLAAQVFQSLPRVGATPERDEESPIFKDLLSLVFGREATEEDRTDAIEGVDHQSQWALPLMFDGKTLHRGFLTDLRKLLLTDDVVVLGGNDNGDGHHLRDRDAELLTRLPREASGSIARKDPKGFWTLFDRQSGTKARFFLEAEPGDLPPSKQMKASSPELVDVKITDFCPHGCAFCYQSSTEKGLHASLENLAKVADALAELEVFEVALGGGEPTEHPEFLEVLKIFSSRGIVTNFTTKSLGWIERIGAQVFPLVKSFAFSVTHPREVEELARLLKSDLLVRRGPFYGSGTVVSIQHVVGTATDEMLQQISLATLENGFSLTLLGYKKVGFGEKWKPKNTNWLPALLEVPKVQQAQEKLGAKPLVHLRFAMDTALAQQSAEQLAALQVPEWMYHTVEGAFSMYIDAVAGEAGPSSYEGKPTAIELSAGAIRDAFAAY